MRRRPLLVALFLAPAACGDGGPSAYVLRGWVSDSGRPLAAVRVRVQGRSDVGRVSFFETDIAGSYALPLRGVGAGDEVTVTGGLPGFKNGALAQVLPRDGVLDEPVDLVRLPPDDPSYRFQSVDTGDPACNSCHFDQVARWRPSPHGQAAKDPLVLDELRAQLAWWQRLDDRTASEAEIFAGPFLPPGDKGDVGAIFSHAGRRYRVVSDGNALDDCARCHAPTWAASGSWDFRPPVLETQDPVHGEGVGCDFCHKLRDVATGTEEQLAATGLDKVALARPRPGEQQMLGPFDDVVFAKMEGSYLPLAARSEMCADCHQDARSLVLQPIDDGGAPSGEAESHRIWGEDTYREWRYDPKTVRSAPGAGAAPANGDGPFTGRDNYAGRPLQCQECHLLDPPPDPKTGERIADWADPALGPTRLAVHVAAAERDPRTLRPHGFEGRSARFVAWATELSATARREGTDVVVEVAVENRHTGHDFPSGLPDRNAILLVEASGGAGPLARSDGPTVPAWGSGDGTTDPARDLAGRPGRGYARLLAGSDGAAPTFYLRAVAEAAPDTRLRPGEIDRSTYRFAAPAGAGQVTVRVRILHRLRFKAQTDRTLARHPDADRAGFETPGDEVVVTIP